MIIQLSQIPADGLAVEETLPAAELDLETDLVHFRGPLIIQALVTRITNAVTVEVALAAVMRVACSRCIEPFEVNLEKKLRLNYSVEPNEQELDLGPDIRQEIMLDYPLQPLCSPGCRGLCPKCGKNLNEGTCGCTR